MRWRSLLELVLGLFFITVVGCGGGSGGGGAKPGEKVALIGGNLEMSGKSGGWGDDSQKGIELAVSEINAKPEQTIKLKFIFEDNKSEPSGSKNVMKKLITQDGVLAVIGAVGSNRTLAAADVAMEEKVPILTHASTNVTVTKKGEYVSRLCYHDDFQGSVMAKFARNTLKANTAIMIVAKGNSYSEGLCVSFKKVFTELGGTIMEELAYQEGTQDFKTHVTTLKQRNPDCVWIPGYHNEVGPFIKQAREGGFNAPFLGGDGWDDPELFNLGGPAIKGNFVCNHFDPNDPNPLVQEFSKKFKDKYGRLPGAMAALGYDAAYVMADAVMRSKELKPPAIKDAINSTKGVKGVCGVVNMGPDREVVKPAVVLETGEKAFKYKETINP